MKPIIILLAATSLSSASFVGGASIVNLATSCRRAVSPYLLAARPVNEFSRLRPVAGLRKQATRHEISATDAECEALATRFDLISIGGLAANVSLAVVDPRRTRVRAYGKFSARVVTKGVTGAEAAFDVDAASFETFFAEDADIGAYDSEDDDTYDEDLEDGQIDMGELVAQHLYLYLSEREQLLIREFSEEYAPGTVVFDSDPDGD
jgi:hypothetical protein